jgi:energy-coupling factor transporter transmembrane protein EcfT
MSARFLHRASPATGLLLLGAFLAVALASGGLLVRAGSVLLVPALALLSGESPHALLRRGRFLLLFALVLVFAQVLFVRGGEPLFSFWSRPTARGIEIGAAMALRFLLIVSSSLLFVLTTGADRLGSWIARSGLPHRYGTVVVLALRFAPFFQQELRAVRDAQRVRGIDASLRTPRGLLRAVRYTFVPVLVAGLSRADALAISMVSRGFGLSLRRTARPGPPLGWRDLVGVLLSLLLVAAAVVSRQEGWP